MTRINLVRPEDLADQHLFAEWREIKMIVPAAKRSMKSKPYSELWKSIPRAYTLNKGHVTFFYDKLRFLRTRFEHLTNECHQRGFDISPFEFANDDYKLVFDTIGQQMGWYPNSKEIQVNIERIAQRLNERPTWYRYYSDVYAPDFFIDRYNQQLLVDVIYG